MKAVLDRIKQGEILVCDGAMGSLLMDRAKEFLQGTCPEFINISHPEIIEEIAGLYINAGADIIETNTFGGSPLKLASYSLDNKTEARYFAKKYSPTKGKVAAINMVPLYYDARETNDTVTEARNDIDSIVKTLMKDDEYSYLSLSELQRDTNNSFKWSKYYSNRGPKYDGLLFVRIEKNSN